MPKTSNADTDERLIKLAQYIEDNANEPLSLGQLAKLIAISSFHLQRKFTAVFGISPKQFQNSIRIQQLKQSLKQGNNITSAIFDAGFGSSSRVYEQIDKNLGMTLSAYRDGGNELSITFALRRTSFGSIIMAATDRGVCFVHFGENFSALIQALHQEFPNAELQPTPEAMEEELDRWIVALEHHLNGQAPKPNLPLHLFGTVFQMKVWKFLVSVKAGVNASYKQVAEGIQSPSAYRAVANACGANNIAVLIPCHRVLRGDGKAGGYRWGEERKKRLLEHEAASRG